MEKVPQNNRHHLTIEVVGLSELIHSISSINSKLDNMAKTQAELAADITALGVTLGKIGTETTTLLQKVADLETKLSDAGNVTPELQAAFDAVKEQATIVDDMVPDAPKP